MPPHFHVEKPGEWEVRVFFLGPPGTMVEVRWGRGPRGKERQKITNAAARKRANLLGEWSSKVAREKK
jgi:hypothetical protein